MSFWLMKRIFKSELTWFNRERSIESMASDRRGVSLAKPPLARRMDLPEDSGVPVSVRWFDGTENCESKMNLIPRKRTCLLEGEPPQARTREKVTESAIVLIHVERGSRDTEGQWTFTLAVVDPRDQNATPVYRYCEERIDKKETVGTSQIEAAELQELAERYLPVFHGGQVSSIGEITLEEENAAADWLARYLDREELEALLNEDETSETDEILDKLGLHPEESPTKRSLAIQVVRRFGTSLLSDRGRRELLAKRRFPKRTLDYPEVGRWVPGKNGALEFTKSLGLPRALAGTPNRREPVVEDITAFPKLGELHPYQEEIAAQIRDVLTAPSWEERRGIIWLPTGTGKTRVTVETLLNECRLDVPRNCVLWIANRRELCEQAIETFRHVWMVRGASTAAGSGPGMPTLRFIRLWEGNDWQDPPSFPTVIVASIQTLASKVRNEGDEWRELLAILGRRCAAIVFDEAHHAVARTYTTVRENLGIARKRNLFEENQRTAPPVFGLTATPSRSADDETERLASQFSGKLLEPTGEYREMRDFIENGYLAEPDYEVIQTDAKLELKGGSEQKAWETFDAIPSSALKRLGEDSARTALIVGDLADRLDEFDSVLVFACSVKHARTIAQVLDRMGVAAASLDGDTPRAVRWQTIREFRRGNLQVLSSCDLLTTGFDAPEVDAVALARPVESRILFAQMVGRGLRGPKNGGTSRCKILDYEDVVGPYEDLENLRKEFRKGFVTAERE